MTTKFMAIQKHNTESKVGEYVKNYKDPVLAKKYKSCIGNCKTMTHGKPKGSFSMN